ncbi:MAG: lytic murein transglycosylase [Planktomarina sp.]
MTFDAWKADFLERTEFPRDLADHLTYLPTPQAADNDQAEHRRSLKQYLDKTVTTARIETGRAMLRLHQDTLDPLEMRYGVPAEILLAIWGMETNFGTYMGDLPVFAALATLASTGRRRAMFEDQLMAAAQMFRMRNNLNGFLTGSWAGAMGHTQFMPRSYLNFAVGFDGGAADIWADDPRDALTSTANYLARHGWTADQTWGAEAKYDRPPMDNPPMDGADWAALGVETVDHPPTGPLRFLLPAGYGNPAFLVTANFDAVLSYNKSDSYALAVCHLADRIKGKNALQGQWNGPQTVLSKFDLQKLQEGLTSLGYDTFGADGFMGPNTAKAIMGFQSDHGHVVDGYPSDDVLINVMAMLK